MFNNILNKIITLLAKIRKTLIILEPIRADFQQLYSGVKLVHVFLDSSSGDSSSFVKLFSKGFKRNMKL